MKKVYSALIVVLVFSGISCDGCSRGYESRKQAGDLEVTLRSGRYPLRIGNNRLSVAVTDGAQKPVTDALVQAAYSLPSVRGKAAPEFKTEAKPKGKGYVFAADIPAAGAWEIEVTVSQPGKPALSATFSIDAG